MTGRRVLVLDGHTNEALACARSLGRAGHTVFVASARPVPLAAWSRYVAARVRHAGETLADYAAVRDWAHSRGVEIVLPLGEPACLLCNAERGAWEAAGMTVGCAPDATLERAFDKAATLDYAVRSGVRIPPTRFPTSLAECHAAAAAVGYPCVVKARRSYTRTGPGFVADRGAAYASNPNELEAAVRSRRAGEDWPLVQGFVPGSGKGVFALCDHGHSVAWFAHERLRDVRPSGSGSSLRRSAPLAARLRAPAERLLAALEWHGPAMVEFRDAGDEPCLMEVNGRFWTSLQLAISAGVDFPRLWVAILSGEPVPVANGYREGVTLRWLWGDVKRFLYIVAGRPPGYPGRYPSIGQGLRELLGHQPPGTQLEAWDRHDPWPAVGEWVTGIGDLWRRAKQ